VTDRVLDGLFHRVEEEAKNFRTKQAARTTDLLKKVSGK